METLLDTTPTVFIGVTVVCMGLAAYMTGQAVASTWRAPWQAIVYAALLAFGSRFLIFALFNGKLLSATGFIIDALVLVTIALFAYRITHVSRMVNQYPWLYRRRGPFAYEQIP
ncbi:MAG: hypothetical protein U1F68_05805 [Gammaproteobacteria bacterium]